MTASAPMLPKFVTFTLGGSSFAEDVIDLEIRPVDPDETIITTLDGVVHKTVGTVSWEMRINTVLDWDSGRPGLAYYLWNNQGSTVAFVYNAHGTGAESASQPKMTGSVVLKPVGYGGDGNVYSEFEVVLPITGTLTRDATP